MNEEPKPDMRYFTMPTGALYCSQAAFDQLKTQLTITSVGPIHCAGKLRIYVKTSAQLDAAEKRACRTK